MRPRTVAFQADGKSSPPSSHLRQPRLISSPFILNDATCFLTAREGGTFSVFDYIFTYRCAIQPQSPVKRLQPVEASFNFAISGTAKTPRSTHISGDGKLTTDSSASLSRYGRSCHSSDGKIFRRIRFQLWDNESNGSLP